MLQRLTGWSVLRVSWFGSLIFGGGLLGMLWWGWNSDRTGERRWHFVIPQMTAAAALGSWFVLPHSNVLLVAMFALLGFGTVAYLPAFWSLPSAFLTRSAAAAAVEPVKSEPVPAPARNGEEIEPARVSVVASVGYCASAARQSRTSTTLPRWPRCTRPPLAKG